MAVKPKKLIKGMQKSNPTVFILIPSLISTGPIKGALALANGLSEHLNVILVAIKSSSGVNSPIHPGIGVISLEHISGGWRGKIKAYLQHLMAAGGRKNVVSISMCFSADLINRFCCAQAFTCASVRANLFENYKYDYGAFGLALASFHMRLLRGFDQVTALSFAMANQLTKYLGHAPEVIGNFVDEAALEPYRSIHDSRQSLRFVFVGSLSRRKQPDLAVQALGVLGPHARLDIIGDGPLRGELEQLVRRLGLGKQIVFHGYLADPLPWVAKADVFVLPSFSEGIARAALEALHLGVPCVLRDVDGNQELIRPRHNGALFTRNEDLPDAVRAAAAIAVTPNGRSRESLLPEAFRQKSAVDKYLHLVESR